MLSPTAPNAIKLTPVNSSKLFALGYDHGLFILRAEFKPSKATYDYFDVPPEVYASLMAAPSLGTYFGIHIAGARGATPPFKFGKVGTPAHLVLWEAALSEGEPASAGGAPTVAELNTAPARELPQQQAPRTIEAAPEPEYIAPVDLPSDQAGLEARAVAVEVETRALVIVPQGRRAVLTTRTPEGYAHAVAMLLAKKDEKKRALEQVETIKGPATKAWQAACAFASKVAASYDASINVLDQAVTDYRNEVKEAERKAADAERATRQAALDAEHAEATRRAQEQAAADAAALRSAGQHEVAREVEATPVYTPRAVASQEVARTSVPTVAGARVSGTWKFAIEDPAQVPRFYMPLIAVALMKQGFAVTEEKLGPLVMDIAIAFAQFHSLDEVKIGGRVRPLKEAAVGLIPGVKVWYDEKTGSTGR